MNYTKLKQPTGMNDKTRKFVMYEIVKLDDFNRTVLQIALVCQSIKLINMTAGLFRGQKNTLGIGSSLTTAPLRYCGSIRSSGMRQSLMLLNTGSI